MTQHDPELSPAQEEEVRRQLAAARHTDPIPPVVAERLDRVLADLSAERTNAPVGAAPVGDLAGRRRRRRAAQLLVAAAAVVAVGFGLDELSGSMGSSQDSSPASDGGFNRAESNAEADNLDGKDPGTEPGPAAAPGLAALDQYRAISPKSFRDDVLGSRNALIGGTGDTGGTAEARAARAARAACRRAAPGEKAVAVAYQGRLATLVYRVPVNGLQRVDLFGCHPPHFLRSITIPRP